VSVIYFSCDKSVEQVTYEGPVQEDPPGSMHYSIRLKASAACPITPIPPAPLSGGWLFIILFGVAIVVYLGVGVFYNHRYREMHGMDLIPQWQYWQQLPGLVKDGCSFSYKQSIWCAHTTKRKWRECQEARGVEELRAPIAAAAE